MAKIGVVLPDLKFRRLPGDAGSHRSYGENDVIFHRIPGIVADDVVTPVPNGKLYEPYLEGALDVQSRGAEVVVTTCGFLAPLQDRISRELRVPFISSSLIQLTSVHRLMGGPIGIVTANDVALTDPYLRAACGEDNVPPIAVVGLQNDRDFADPILKDVGEINFERVEQSVTNAATRLLTQSPDIKAFVCECHNLPTFAGAVQRVTGRPVFDVMTLVSYVLSSIVQNRFPRDFGDVR